MSLLSWRSTRDRDVRFGEQAELEYTFRFLHDSFHAARSSDERLRVARGMVELLRAIPDIAPIVEDVLKREVEGALEEFDRGLSIEERMYIFDEEYREIVLSPARRARIAAGIVEKQRDALAWAYYRAAMKVAYEHGLLIRVYTPMKVEVPEVFRKLFGSQKAD